MTEPAPVLAPVLTIDGPVGAGKGTISQLAARRLGWHLLDSGALYRVLALAAQRRGASSDDVSALVGLAADLPIRFEPDPGGPARVVLAGEDVSGAVRGEACGESASRLAALPAVREGLLTLQRGFRKSPGLVADGRDMGTVVFPDAQVKIFLTGSLEARAARRHKQLIEKGISVSLAPLSRDIAERDRRDRERETAPLKPADDAVMVDTTGVSINEVLEHVLAIVAARGLVD